MEILNMKKRDVVLELHDVSLVWSYRKLMVNGEIVWRDGHDEIRLVTVDPVSTPHDVGSAQVLCTQKMELLLSVSHLHEPEINGIWHHTTVIDHQRVEMLIEETTTVKRLLKDGQTSRFDLIDPWRADEHYWTSFDI